MRRILIAGGGNIGLRLAAAIENRYRVKLIEQNKARAEYLANQVKEVLVLLGDATDEALLERENIWDMDLFLALTNDDENNIMASLLANRMGARRVLALINRRAYADLVQADRIDIALSPAQVSIGSLLAHVRHGDVEQVHSLRRGAAEAIELVAHGDRKTSKVVGRRVEELNLPRGVTAGAILRRKIPLAAGVHDAPPPTRDELKVVIAHHDTLIEPEDHVILFVVNKRLGPQGGTAVPGWASASTKPRSRRLRCVALGRFSISSPWSCCSLG